MTETLVAIVLVAMVALTNPVLSESEYSLLRYIKDRADTIHTYLTDTIKVKVDDIKTFLVDFNSTRVNTWLNNATFGLPVIKSYLVDANKTITDSITSARDTVITHIITGPVIIEPKAQTNATAYPPFVKDKGAAVAWWMVSISNVTTVANITGISVATYKSGGADGGLALQPLRLKKAPT